MPVKPLAARATSSAACGGQIESRISQRRQSSPTSPASSSPAARARSAVAALRPAEAQSTVSPRAAQRAADRGSHLAGMQEADDRHAPSLSSAFAAILRSPS